MTLDKPCKTSMINEGGEGRNFAVYCSEWANWPFRNSAGDWGEF